MRAAGVAICQNTNTSHIATFNSNLTVQHAMGLDVSQVEVGGLCGPQIYNSAWN